MQTIEDLVFLQNQFNKLTDSQRDILPTDYVERVRYLPSELTPMPGKYSYDRFPYLREIVNHLSQKSDARKVVFLKPAQIGATTGIIESGMAFKIGCEPGSMLFISADKELVKIGMETKVERLLDSCGLRDKIFSQTAKKGNQTGDTTTSKEFAGGFLHAIGARNPGKLRQMSYQTIFMDELDGFPQTVGNEGSPIDLAEKRSKAFSATRKIFYLSTPTITQTSHVYALYKLGNQCHWYMPCYYCETMQVFQWHGISENNKEYGIVFETEKGLPIFESVGYLCPHCNKIMKNYHKSEILQYGEWRPTEKSKEPGLYSYWTNSLVSPVGIYSWEDMVVEWAKCWDLEKNRIKDIDKYKTFRNTDEGKPFEERNETIKREKVHQYKNYNYIKNQILNFKFKEYSGSEIMLLTAAVDVQKNCIYVQIIGWTIGGRHYTIDFLKIDGITEDYNSIVWKELDKLICEKTWIADDEKQYRISQTVIDSGKYTDYVYAFCKLYSSGVIAIKGDEKIYKLTFKEFNSDTLKRAGLPVAYHVNTTMIKDRIARMFNLRWDSGQFQEEWYPNFPEDARDDELEQFEAEEKIDERDRITNKWIRSRWKLISGRDNHLFDCMCYNICNLEIIADGVCRNELGLNYLNWNLFWEFCKTGAFYQEK